MADVKEIKFDDGEMDELQELQSNYQQKQLGRIGRNAQARRASDCSKLGEPQPQTPRRKAWGFSFARANIKMIVINTAQLNMIRTRTILGPAPILVRTRTKCYSQRLVNNFS